MIEPQMSSFWQAAVRSGLLDEGALRKSWDSIDPDKRTPEAIDRRLARQIVNAGGLTLWQAQQLLAGRWQGLRIDKYELRNVIGQGGMGRVYLARDVRLDRKVALKILSRERMSNSRALARFRREAKVGAQLQHENLVRIYDEGEAHGVRYLVMEYIEGKTVGRLISELGRIPPRSAADIAYRVALGLEHLHHKGLLHRDVNPMNILIDRDGTPKLTDLGLAIDMEDDDDVVTRDGATVGTFDYISPEQAKHSRMIDARADLYSLGCTLYHMLTGRVPFPTPSLAEKLYAHQLNQPEALIGLVPDLPEGLGAVVSKLMRKSPEDRYRRASDVARALEPFSGAVLSASRIAAGLSSTTLEAPTVPSRSAGGETELGSDPDLDLASRSPDPAAAAAAAPADPRPSDPLDFFRQIDLGPEPSLSGTRSAERSREPRVRAWTWPKVPRVPVVVVLASLAVVLAAAGIYRIGGGGTGGASASGPSRPGSPSDHPADSGHAVAIRYPDGNELPQPSLRAAMQRLAGGGGEIVLRSAAPMRADGPGEALRLDGGSLVIRAVGAARPELLVDLDRSVPWINVSPRASLSLIGLTVRVEVPAAAAASPGSDAPCLVASDGPVTIERCRFTTAGRDRSARVLSCRGLVARVTGGFFEGFDRPITLEMYPGARAEFAQCLFVRDPVGPSEGWAIDAVRRLAMTEAPRILKVERCTVLGAGLLSLQGFDTDAPLAVTVAETAVKANALVMTAVERPKLPGALAWTGRGNLYGISGTAWVVVPPRGFDGLPGGPSDLSAWAELYPTDVRGEASIVRFAGAVGEGHIPSDFAVTRDPPVGADPQKVGPGGAP